jgi:hypothetical protein
MTAAGFCGGIGELAPVTCWCDMLPTYYPARLGLHDLLRVLLDIKLTAQKRHLSNSQDNNASPFTSHQRARRHATRSPVFSRALSLDRSPTHHHFHLCTRSPSDIGARHNIECYHVTTTSLKRNFKEWLGKNLLRDKQPEGSAIHSLQQLPVIPSAPSTHRFTDAVNIPTIHHSQQSLWNVCCMCRSTLGKAN